MLTCAKLSDTTTRAMWSCVLLIATLLNHLGSGVYGGGIVGEALVQCHNGKVDVKLVDGVCICTAGYTCVGMHCTHGHKLTTNAKTAASVTTNNDAVAADAHAHADVDLVDVHVIDTVSKAAKDDIGKSLEAVVVHGFRPNMCSECECRHPKVAHSVLHGSILSASALRRDGHGHGNGDSDRDGDGVMQVSDTGRTSNNVVLSMAFNYSLARHRIFVLSLRNSGYVDDIVLFVDHQSFVDETLSGFLHEHRVIVRDVSDFHPPDTFMQRHPKLLRYHLYAVEASKAKYVDGLILMIDFRDVVFQGDPFASVSLRGGEWLRFYAEVFPPNMQESYYTYEWIKECWGDSMPENIGSAIIICSGATMGTPAGVKHYVDEMVNAMKNAPREACMAIAHDQRFHNYLLYTGVFKQVKVLHAGHAEVYNLGYIGRQDRRVQRIKPHRYLHIDDTFNGTLVTNEDYSIPAVLHQYDRFEALKQFVETKYKL